MRSQPGLALAANWNVPNTCTGAGCLSVQNLLGRIPPGGNANGTTTVALLDDSTHRLYAGERRTQIDLRVAKVLRFGRTRTDLGFDVGNLFNTNYATAYEPVYQYSVGNTENGGTWNNPTAVYTPRFLRVNATFNF